MLKKMCKKRGFTLMETLGVIAIIVILCAIAIPTVISVRATMAQKQLDSYAKTIYLAAQNNLVEMRRDNELGKLPDNLPLAVIPENTAGKYAYVASGNTGFDTVLPANSVETALTANKIIIEFNPKTGAVYSVFYSEGEDIAFYSDADTVKEIRAEETRKKHKVGYYNGTDLSISVSGSETKLQIANVAAKLQFDRGEEGILKVVVPVEINKDGQFADIVSNPVQYIKDLTIKLLITGENGGTIEKTITTTGEQAEGYEIKSDPLVDGADAVWIPFSLDSLLAEKGFDDLSAVKDESGNVTYQILPGDNISVTAEVTYKEGSADDLILDIDSAVLAGVNPMFDSMVKNEESGKYTLAVANGRHLQNLNLLDAGLAANVESVVFVADDLERKAAEDAGTEPEIIIDWKATQDYYTDPTTKMVLVDYQPIANEVLFGSAELKNGKLEEKVFSADTVYAAVIGNGCKIKNLSIDVNNVNAEGQVDGSVPFVGLFGYVNSSVSGIELVNPKVVGGDKTLATGALAGAIGSKAQLTDCGVYLDNKVEGFDMAQYGVTGHGAVGGLVGYACSDNNVGNTVDLSLTPDELKKAGIELKDFVSFYRCVAAVPVDGTMPTKEGEGGSAVSLVNGDWNGVGGLVGNAQQANFYSCYASGTVDGKGVVLTKENSKSNEEILEDLLNKEIEFDSLEDVLEQVAIYDDILEKLTAKTMGFTAKAKESQGVGGFVGTSGGSIYSNCFSTGNVLSDGNAAGGFVGLMSYNSSASVLDAILGALESEQLTAQHSMFNSCYSVGTVSVKAAGQTDALTVENFSGANAGGADMIAGNVTNLGHADFYKLHGANYAVNHKTLPLYHGSYIFKDSHYLNQAMTAVAEYCATAERYSSFMELHTRKDMTVEDQNNNWLKDELGILKNTTLVSVSLDYPKVEALKKNLEVTSFVPTMDMILELIDDTTGKGLLAKQILDTVAADVSNADLRNLAQYVVTCNGDIKYDVFFAVASALQNDYVKQYQSGFSPDVWGVCAEGTTIAYDDTTGKYPFSMLNGMKYYGTWPEMNLNAGLAYYEAYEAMDEDEYRLGFHYDSDASATLNNNGVAISDGYAVICNDQTATLGNSKDRLPAMRLDNGGKFYYSFLSAEEMAKQPEEGFWSSYETTVSGEKCSFKFNPNLALTHNHEGEGVPEVFYVRSARQFAAVGEYMDSFWKTYKIDNKEYCHQYVQQLDIDFEKYNACTYGNGVVWAFEPIGNSTTEFNAIYTVPMKGGEYLTKQIVGYPYTNVADEVNSGIFGVIGEKGSISGLEIVPVVEKAVLDEDGKKTGELISELKIETKDADTVGLLAGINKGTIKNTAIVLTGDVSISNKKDADKEYAAPQKAGLLVGRNDGMLDNCSVITPTHTIVNNDKDGEYKTFAVDVSITATNAGMLAGSVEGGTVKNAYVGPQKDATAKGTINLTVKGSYIGGLIGRAADAVIGDKNNLGVEVHLTSMNLTEATCAGGLLGYVQLTDSTKEMNVLGNSSVETKIIIDKKIKNDDSVFIGGAVGYANGGSYTNTEVNVVFEDNRVAYQPSVNTNPETTEKTETPVNPSDKGNIGLFAGYIRSGNFANCSSTGANPVDENNKGYQFLGTAVATGKEAISASHYDTVQYSEEQLKAMAPGTLKEVTLDMQPVERYIFPLKLENCRFISGAMEYLQVIGGELHFYNQGNTYTVKEAGAIFTEATDIDTTAWKAYSDWTETNYYAADVDKEKENTIIGYKRVYAKATAGAVDENGNPVYEFAVKKDEETAGFDSLDEEDKLYSISVGVENQQYLLLGVSDEVGLENEKAPEQIQESMLWTYKNGKLVNSASVEYTINIQYADYYAEKTPVAVTLMGDKQYGNNGYLKFRLNTVAAAFTYVGSNDTIRAVPVVVNPTNPN